MSAYYLRLCIFCVLKIFHFIYIYIYIYIHTHTHTHTRERKEGRDGRGVWKIFPTIVFLTEAFSKLKPMHRSYSY